MPETERRMTDLEFYRAIADAAVQNPNDPDEDPKLANWSFGNRIRELCNTLESERVENARLRELNQLRAQHSGALEELLKACWSQGKTPTNALDTRKRTAYKIRQIHKVLTEQEANDE